MTSRLWITSCALLLCSASASAQQQTVDDADRAEKLFTEAAALATDGKYEEACPKLEESQRLDAGLGTQFNLAVCYEHVGKLASAWRNFKEIEHLAHATAKTGREEAAHAKAAALGPKVGHFVFSKVAADTMVTVDGQRVDHADLAFYAVDPGSHTVVASAPRCARGAPWLRSAVPRAKQCRSPSRPCVRWS